MLAPRKIWHRSTRCVHAQSVSDRKGRAINTHAKVLEYDDIDVENDVLAKQSISEQVLRYKLGPVCTESHCVGMVILYTPGP